VLVPQPDKRRQRKSQEQPSYRGRRAEEAAKAARDLDRQLRAVSRRRWVARGLLALAGVVLVIHLLAHSGWRALPIGMGWQDLLVGYPMAGLLVIAGAILIGSTPSRR